MKKGKEIKQLLTSHFGKKGSHSVRYNDTSYVVVYTRVSSKEQRDKNMSLEWQRENIERYAERNGFNILEFFGGTYESAKSDGRKEFQRMLTFIKRSRRKVSKILVYSMDRFSRTGSEGAIGLAAELRKKYGVTILAVTQPSDTKDFNGQLQQNLQLIFSQYDNQIRRQRAIDGMKAKMRKGEWVTPVPPGYDKLWVNGVRKIKINKEGKYIKKAFEWKALGWKNEKIMERMEEMGFKNIYKQKLSKIFSNPFYCGYMAHGILDGEVQKGNHPPLISLELFLKVNEVRAESGGKLGVKHAKEFPDIPLKVFMKCFDCGNPMTGYKLVKRKSRHGKALKQPKIYWYYKCRTKGCKCSKGAEEMNNRFAELLYFYAIDDKLVEPLKFKLLSKFKEKIKESDNKQKALKGQLTEIDKKIETLQEKHFITGEINEDLYKKFSLKYDQEKADIMEKMDNVSFMISNYQKLVENSITLLRNLPEIWASQTFEVKERFQKLIFPDGIQYNKKTGDFLTPKTNDLVRQTLRVVKGLDKKKKGQNGNDSDLSLSAERGGFEPPVPF